jgi:hypothetical protein
LKWYTIKQTEVLYGCFNTNSPLPAEESDSYTLNIKTPLSFGKLAINYLSKMVYHPTTL